MLHRALFGDFMGNKTLGETIDAKVTDAKADALIVAVADALNDRWEGFDRDAAIAYMTGREIETWGILGDMLDRIEAVLPEGIIPSGEAG